jgi:hypothetical protein
VARTGRTAGRLPQIRLQHVRSRGFRAKYEDLGSFIRSCQEAYIHAFRFSPLAIAVSFRHTRTQGRS